MRPQCQCFVVLHRNPTLRRINQFPSFVNLGDINTAYTSSAKRSEGLEFAEVDSNDDNLFNEILWKGIKGELAQLPAPRRSAFVRVVKVDK